LKAAWQRVLDGGSSLRHSIRGSCESWSPVTPTPWILSLFFAHAIVSLSLLPGSSPRSLRRPCRRVFKKASPNEKVRLVSSHGTRCGKSQKKRHCSSLSISVGFSQLTCYLGRREFFDHGNRVDPIGNALAPRERKKKQGRRTRKHNSLFLNFSPSFFVACLSFYFLLFADGMVTVDEKYLNGRKVFAFVNANYRFEMRQETEGAR
jgi:hypothetical protein